MKWCITGIRFVRAAEKLGVGEKVGGRVTFPLFIRGGTDENKGKRKKKREVGGGKWVENVEQRQ